MPGRGGGGAGAPGGPGSAGGAAEGPGAAEAAPPPAAGRSGGTMPVMKGLLAPQNTFLDTIANRFDGTRRAGTGPGRGRGGKPGGGSRCPAGEGERDRARPGPADSGVATHGLFGTVPYLGSVLRFSGSPQAAPVMLSPLPVPPQPRSAPGTDPGVYGRDWRGPGSGGGDPERTRLVSVRPRCPVPCPSGARVPGAEFLSVSMCRGRDGLNSGWVMPGCHTSAGTTELSGDGPQLPLKTPEACVSRASCLPCWEGLV